MIIGRWTLDVMSCFCMCVISFCLGLFLLSLLASYLHLMRNGFSCRALCCGFTAGAAYETPRCFCGFPHVRSRGLRLNFRCCFVMTFHGVEGGILRRISPGTFVDSPLRILHDALTLRHQVPRRPQAACTCLAGVEADPTSKPQIERESQHRIETRTRRYSLLKP